MFATKRVDITESQGKSPRYLAAWRVGERTAEGSRLGLGPAGSDAGAVDTTMQQAMVLCTLFEGNVTTEG